MPPTNETKTWFIFSEKTCSYKFVFLIICFNILTRMLLVTENSPKCPSLKTHADDEY